MKRFITLTSAALLLCGLANVTLAQTAAQKDDHSKSQKVIYEAICGQYSEDERRHNEESKEEIRQTAKTVGRGTVKAAKTVGRGTVKAANTVGRGTVKAANTVAQGTKKAANTVANGAKKAANNFVKLFKKR